MQDRMQYAPVDGCVGRLLCAGEPWIGWTVRRGTVAWCVQTEGACCWCAWDNRAQNSHHHTGRCPETAAEPFGVGQVGEEHQERTQHGAGACCDHQTKGQGNVWLCL